MAGFRWRLCGHAVLVAVVAFVITAQFAHSLPYPKANGYAAYYRPGLMAQVARNRGLPIVPCMVASPYHPIGTWVTVASAKGTRRCRVTDVPHPRDLATVVKRGIVVELDFTSNRLLCPPRAAPKDCPVRVTK